MTLGTPSLSAPPPPALFPSCHYRSSGNRVVELRILYMLCGSVLSGWAARRTAVHLSAACFKQSPLAGGVEYSSGRFQSLL